MEQIAPAIVGSVGDVQLSLPDFWRFLKSTYRLKEDLAAALVEECAVRAAIDAGLTVSPDELQQAANRCRYRLGLRSAADTHRWLASHVMTADEWEQALSRKLLVEKFGAYLVDCHGESHFHQAPTRFERARLRRIVVSSEGMARELLCQVNEEDRDFAELAATHSLDNASRSVGGAIGTIVRCQLNAASAEKVFAAQPGDTVGPVLEPEGYVVFLVEDLLPPSFDEAVRDVIKHELVARFVNEKRGQIELCWQ
jgi:hypothetical protein